jgi:hypothetical protein
MPIEENKELQYIPQLNLYYDANRDVYMNEDGYVINTQTYSGRPTNNAKINDDTSLSSMKFDLHSVIKIVSATVLVVGQYYVIDGKFKDMNYSIQSVEKELNLHKDTMADTSHQLNILTAQQGLQGEILNSIQVKMANDIKNTKQTK